jgi:hypothetical protein
MTWYDTPRFVFLLLAGALTLAWLAVRRPQPPASMRPWVAALLAVAATSAVSAALAEQQMQLLTYGAEMSLMGAPSWIALCVLGFVVALPDARRHYRAIMSVLVLAACASIAIGTFEWFDTGRAGGGFGNGNFLGTVVVCCTPLALLLARAERSAPKRLAWLAALAALAWGIWISASVTVFAVLLVQAVVLAVAAPRVLGASSDRTRLAVRGVGIAIVSVAVLVGAAYVATPAVLPSPVGDTLEREFGGVTLMSRMARWDMAFDVFRGSPLLGVGPDGLDLASQAAMTEEYVVREPVRDGVSKLMRDPHSLPLLILSTSGLIGLVVALGLAGVWSRAVAAGLRRIEGGRNEALGLTALAAASFFMCLLLIPWCVCFAALPSLLGGMALGMAASGPRGDTDSPVPARGMHPGLIRAASAALALALAAIGVSGAVGELAFARSFVADTPEQAVDAARLARSAQPTRVAAAVREAEVVGELMLADLRPPQEFVDVVEGLPPEARQFAPHLSSLARTAMDYIVIYGEPEGFLAWARSLAEEAQALAPILPEANVELAHAAILNGDVPAGLELLDLAEAQGYPAARLELYRYYAAMALGDTVAAQAHASAAVAEIPGFAPLVRWDRP